MGTIVFILKQMSHKHADHRVCCHASSVTSVNQSLDEMEFERGIWSAALEGNESRVQNLLKEGKHPNARDSSGYTALHYSARAGHVGVCGTLLDAGACINACTNGGATSLHRAALLGRTEVVQLLLSRCADVNICDNDGQNVLHKAAERAQEEVIHLLLKHAPVLDSVKDKRNRLPQDLLPENKKHLFPIIKEYRK